MNDWFVELAGHESDLSVLPRILTASKLFVVKKGNRYFLKSIELDRLTSGQEVYAHAKNIINVLNGLAGVYIDGFVNVALSGGVEWSDDSGPHRSIFVEAKSAFRISASASLGDNGGEVVPTVLTDADNAATAAANEKIVDRALNFFSMEKNWFNLYKVLDAITVDLKSLEAVKAQNWVPQSEIKRFTGTANNHTAAGGEARHGFDFGKPVSNPMTLGEAELLIRTILDRWLESKK